MLNTVDPGEKSSYSCHQETPSQTQSDTDFVKQESAYIASDERDYRGEEVIGKYLIECVEQVSNQIRVVNSPEPNHEKQE